jgi:Transglutaminase-like superfamily
VHARFLLGLGLAAVSAVVSASETHRWQRVMAREDKVGRIEHVRREDGAQVVETETLEMQLGRGSRRTTYRVTLDTESSIDGALLRMTREVKTREGHSLIDARVLGDDLEVTSGLGRSKTTQTLSGVGATLKSAEYARPWLMAVGRGESRSALHYSTWDPSRQFVVEIELVQIEPDATGMRIERRLRSGRDASSAVQTIDATGNVVRETMILGSITLVVVDSSEAEALTRNQMFDHVGELSQKSPYRIPARDMREKIRYGFDNHGATPTIPVGAGQRTWTQGQTTIVQVCASCALDAIELLPADRAQALESTQWLQSRDGKLATRARGIVAGANSDAQRMTRLTTFVRNRMGTEIDMLGYGTAIEAFESGRGDCTEFAVLLAAMGRAAGVPTRIAIGSVYARHFEGATHVFVPHAWVQAWTGTGWQSFDAAIGNFDSTHLAFAVSYDGSPAHHFAGIALAHQLTMISAARVLPRKAPAN